MKEYPFVLTTGARSWVYFHSEQRHVDVLREIHPDPITQIHPDTAKQLGIKDGDWVWVENQFGRAKQRAQLFPGIDRRVIHSQHAWWYPERPAVDGEYGPEDVFLSNINNLIPHETIGKLGFGAPYKCMICKVYKAEE